MRIAVQKSNSVHFFIYAFSYERRLRQRSCHLDAHVILGTCGRTNLLLGDQGWQGNDKKVPREVAGRFCVLESYVYRISSGVLIMFWGVVEDDAVTAHI